MVSNTNKLAVEEATKIIEVAEEKGILLRMLGAVAFEYHSHSVCRDKLGRDISDLDFVTLHKNISRIAELFKSLGYSLNWGIYSHSRKVFEKENQNSAKMKVDVFFDELNMCHRIRLADRLRLNYPTIPLADLLLEKLQIVNITAKDIKDCLTLLYDHNVGNSDDEEEINSQYISEILCRDWGFYYTATTNLKRVLEALPTFKSYINPFEAFRSNIERKINQLLEDVRSRPKSLGWKMRARIGVRKKWYQEVEDIE